MTRVVFVQGGGRRRRARKSRHHDLLVRVRRLVLLLALAAVVILAVRAPVRRIHVKESPVADGPQLRQALSPILNRPLYLFDASPARAALEADPWVAEAKILRRLPGRVTVVLRPASPVFRLEGRGGSVDRRGNVLPSRDAFDLSGLPALRGVAVEGDQVADPARASVTELATALSEVPWNRMFSPREIRWTDQGIELVSSLGMTIRLGAADYQAKLRRLAAVESQITPSAVIDLRFDRQVLLSPDAGPAPAGG